MNLSLYLLLSIKLLNKILSGTVLQASTICAYCRRSTHPSLSSVRTDLSHPDNNIISHFSKFVPTF
ncbi:hypothetical protein 7t3_040 [Salmonella phage 7t3]|nr:hypothetical protein 7t3_040 [Salmonella phage 7t3]